MDFDRKIKYLDHIVDGERVRGAGFVRAEVRDRSCHIIIQVRGLHGTDHFEKSVLLVYGEKECELCRIQISEGKGSTGELALDSRYLGTDRISYHEVDEIRIPIAAGRELKCRWKEKDTPSGTERRVQEAPELQAADNLEDVTGETPGRDFESEAVVSSAPEPEPPAKAPRFPLEDKWSQLSEIYPHVYPFEDEREYLALGPSDFVIFPSAYYRLVNNSFLLHGYHNYEHLLLGRTEKKGQVRYYVGVPGNYYEKEKQVAVMFGFESFECRSEPAGQGDYGYYMMRVEL